MDSLEIQLLGRFGVFYNGQEVRALQTERLALFLAYLSLNCDSPVARKQLAFLFWPDSNEEQARSN